VPGEHIRLVGGLLKLIHWTRKWKDDFVRVVGCRDEGRG
jgi:hypothetical protein